MKKYKQDLPTFTPFNKIIVCSNTLCVKYLLEISGFYPIIIGKGEKSPLIWLYTINKETIIPIVEKNQSLTSQIKVNINKTLINVEIYDIRKKEWTDIITIDFNNPELPIINSLDLRPIGINIYGDEKELTFSNNKLKNITIIGAETLIGIN